MDVYETVWRLGNALVSAPVGRRMAEFSLSLRVLCARRRLMSDSREILYS
jgi:hypothetical protein